ncbi:MAG TPA: hypothetical protein VEV17_07020 [Bryobacteraceae bacterium]|nr:hypothetical protein [Bryobacteraceae bacterium]
MKLPGAGAVCIVWAAGSIAVRAQQLTFARDIAPIIYENCARCHHAGEQDRSRWQAMRTFRNARGESGWHAAAASDLKAGLSAEGRRDFSCQYDNS